LIDIGAVAIIVPILVEPTFQNVVALVASLDLALAFALKDYGSSLVAGLVAVPDDMRELLNYRKELNSVSGYIGIYVKTI